MRICFCELRSKSECQEGGEKITVNERKEGAGMTSTQITFTPGRDRKECEIKVRGGRETLTIVR